MMIWWNDRTGREQTLILAVGVLALLLVLFQLAVKPLWAYRAAAEAAQVAATSTLADVEAAAQEIHTLSREAPDRKPGSLQTVVGVTASEHGLSLSRFQPMETGSLDVWLEAASTKALFTWIADLQDRHGISVVRASLQRNEGATVRAQLTFSEATP